MVSVRIKQQQQFFVYLFYNWPCSRFYNFSSNHYLQEMLLSFFLSYFERKCKQVRGREKQEKERIPSRLHAVSTEPDVGLKLMNSEIMTWAEADCLMDWATQVPPILLFSNFYLLCLLLLIGQLVLQDYYQIMEQPLKSS